MFMNKVIEQKLSLPLISRYHSSQSHLQHDTHPIPTNYVLDYRWFSTAH